VNPLSQTVSQSSSAPLQSSAGGLHDPQLQLVLHVREPVEPHPVVHGPTAPRQHMKPSSHALSQSSSAPLQTSAGGVQLPQVHEPLHVREPVLPQLEVQLPAEPCAHMKPLSIATSQSSSRPLQVSAGGVQTPHVHDALQVREPDVPQLDVQLPELPCTHVKPSSITVSQSSSMPLQASAGGAHTPHEHVALQVREPVVPQLEVQLPFEPARHVKPSSKKPSQSSSAPLHVSTGGRHAPQLQLELQVREPVEPQLVTQLPVAPTAHTKPSSIVASQSSSAPLQTSAGGAQLPHVHVPLHTRVPVLPQLDVQLPVEPWRHTNASSKNVSQSSSPPLQVSAGGVQPPHAHVPLHVREPVVPHELRHEPVDPAAHVKPSSTSVSQSSSVPLHVSAGGLHAPHAHEPLQVREPDEPQLVVHVPLEPAAHVKPSSTIVSQSSSIPLHASAGGAHEPHAHDAVQVREPVEPQLEVHAPLEPAAHVKPSSTSASQSSSSPLQVSAGGLHVPHVHIALQVREPAEPQLVVHAPIAPAAQVRLSSMRVSQSSSAPLHASPGGVHAPHAHVPLQTREPVVPQLVVHEPLEPAAHVKPSSTVASQSSSIPLHVSTGGVHVPQPHEALQTREPVEPQLVVHEPVVPRQHAKPSSQPATQSSSIPLHTSVGGVHVP
jgi:hypothetical protein